MNNKTLFFFDTETSGLMPDRHGILQIAWIIEKNGAVLRERVMDVKPGVIDLNLNALAVNNFTLERMMVARDAQVVLEELRNDVKLAVGGGPALTPCGHNVKFDIDFLHALARGCNATWWLNFGQNDYLNLKKPLCTVAMCHWLDYAGVLSLPDYKLTTCCKGLDIELVGAHDALQDVRATRQLFHKLEGLMRPISAASMTHSELAHRQSNNSVCGTDYVVPRKLPEVQHFTAEDPACGKEITGAFDKGE